MRTTSFASMSLTLYRVLLFSTLSFLCNIGIAAELEKEFINSSQSYSQVVTVTSGGVKTIYVSGQIGIQDGQIPDSFAEQVDIVFTNMTSQLETAGATLEDVIKLNGYIVDIDGDKVSQYSQVRSRHFSSGNPPPASTLVGVTGLAISALQVEVEAVAVIEDQ